MLAVMVSRSSLLAISNNHEVGKELPGGPGFPEFVDSCKLLDHRSATLNSIHTDCFTDGGVSSSIVFLSIVMVSYKTIRPVPAVTSAAFVVVLKYIYGDVFRIAADFTWANGNEFV